MPEVQDLIAPTDKADFYARWKAGEFGNRIRIFDTLADLRASDYRGPVSVRYKDASSQQFTRYLFPQEALDGFILTAVCHGAEEELFTFNEPAPDAMLTMQGEFYHGTEGYCLFCSTEQTQMRPALTNSGKQFYGLQALGRMKAYCNANSYEMMMELLDKYPEAVIEFSCYSRCLGTIPGLNTVIWEVRNY